MEAEHPRKEQTGTIVRTILLVAALFIGWQQFNRDFSAMAPSDRCGYLVYQWRHGWTGLDQCRAAVAVAILSSEPFRDDNPYK